MWVEITYPFLNFNDTPFKFGNGWVISLHTLLGLWLHIHTGIKVNPCWWKEPLNRITEILNFAISPLDTCVNLVIIDRFRGLLHEVKTLLTPHIQPAMVYYVQDYDYT